MANRRPIPPETRQVVYNKYGGHCAYCGKKLTYREMQVDHVFSVCNNGENNDIGNLMPACRMCNFYKSTYTIEQFRARLGKILGRLNKRVYIYRLACQYGLVEEHDKEVIFYFERCKNDQRESD
jgi:hypothetical protein